MLSHQGAPYKHHSNCQYFILCCVPCRSCEHHREINSLARKVNYGRIKFTHRCCYVRKCFRGWGMAWVAQDRVIEIVRGCTDDSAALYCCPGCWCPASDGSLKPGTKLKQTKVSFELPLKPIKADSSAHSYVSILLQRRWNNRNRGAGQKKEGEIALPSNFSLSNTEQCRWALSIRLLFLYPIS